MKIQIACEDQGTFFKTGKGNFPYKIGFVDRTTGTLVEADLDLSTFKKLLADIQNQKEH